MPVVKQASLSTPKIKTMAHGFGNNEKVRKKKTSSVPNHDAINERQKLQSLSPGYQRAEACGHSHGKQTQAKTKTTNA